MPNKTKKKKKSLELNFREAEFQNVTIGLKNATIGPLEPGVGIYKKFCRKTPL